MANDFKVFLLSDNNSFSKHVCSCLTEDLLDVSDGVVLPNFDPDVVIINLFSISEKIEKQIDDILKSKIKKIILIQNALDLYLNSKNSLPFSVYSKIIPKNEICERCLAIEQKIIDSKKQHVIFRVSEMYGMSISGSLIEKFLFTTTGEFDNSLRDFIYDGDVISAIEVALRKEVSGIFDIASGNSIELKKLVELIKRIRKNEEYDIKWRRKKIEIAFNCENFKFYKWEPLVNLEIGLKTLLTFRRKNGNLQCTRNSIRKDF